MTGRLRRWLVATVVIGALGLALSGEWTSPIVWTFVGGMSALVLYATTATESDLAKERLRPPSPGLDRVALRWIRIAALATAVISPLDGGRLHWSPPLPDTVRLAGMLGALVAFALVLHSMVVNRYFSTVIRIQDDRGHRVVDSGPYAFIRHPGYAGMITGVPLMAIGFGSSVGFACACVYSALILRRVAMEDSFLRSNLPGYVDYSGRVRSRLIPGLW